MNVCCIYYVYILLCLTSFIQYKTVYFFYILKTKTLPDMKNNINNFKQIPSFFYIIVIIITIIIIEQCIYKLHKIQVYCMSVCISEELKRNIKIACNAYSQRVLCFNIGVSSRGL